MPELRISTNAGGWYKSGFTLECPKYICDDGNDISLDVQNKHLLPVVLSVIRELRAVFGETLYHFGTDERKNSLRCFSEANPALFQNRSHIDSIVFHYYERKLSALLEMEGLVPKEGIVRWQNDESVIYDNRIGNFTQCQPGRCNFDAKEASQWFATVSLSDDDLFKIYTKTRNLALRRPAAILADLEEFMFDTEAYRLGGRMVAFAIGNLDIPSMDVTAFADTFSTLCKEVFPEIFELECKNITVEKPAESERTFQRARLRDQRCLMQTKPSEQKTFREHVKQYVTND
jgi:hypothetical protein